MISLQVNSHAARPIGCALLIAVVGCAAAMPNGGSLAGTRNYLPRARTESQISLYLEGDALPPCTVNRVGVVMYDDSGGGWGPQRFGTIEGALAGLRAYLATRGVDGAIDVVCPNRGTVGFGTCQGTAYVCDGN